MEWTLVPMSWVMIADTNAVHQVQNRPENFPEDDVSARRIFRVSSGGKPDILAKV